MRETFKSLSIFSAMLLVLLLISSGCVVNIPGCGKRTLPFFKKTSDSHSMRASALPNPIHQLPISIDNINRPTSVSTKTSKPSKSQGEMEISMAPKATPTQRPLPTATPTPQAVEEFAYTLLQNGKNALWTMNTDGSNSTQLSPRGTQNWFPLWSPNGKLLAFLSNQNDGKINLFVIKKGETKARQITFYDDLTLPSPGTLK
ncbi:MAG: TolB family protein, partial [bacterium]